MTHTAPVRPRTWIALTLVASSCLLRAAGIATSSATPALLPGARRVALAGGRVVVVERAEEQVLLVSVRLGNVPLADSLPVYPIPGGVLVPLGELCRLVQFAIEVEASEGRARGWFIQPKRTFSFDALTGTATVEGRARPTDPRRFEVQPQDIFVEASLLGEWFPVDIKVDPRAATLVLTPKARLPIQDQWERDGKMARFSDQSAKALLEQRRKYLPLNVPYGLADVPVVDETLQLAYAGSAERRVSLVSTTLTTGDLLGLEHQGYVSYMSQGQRHPEVRVTLGRKDPGGGLLGPLRATQFQVGDVMGQGLDMIMGGGAGKGFLITNQPVQRDYLFDRRSFRGNLPPGWQVELYHNATLIGMQSVRPDGLYEFLDVPMRYGSNEFKLVLYGPQGQRREEVYRSDVDTLQVPKGAFRYRLYGQEPTLGARRGLLETEYGLASQLSVGASAATLTLPEGPGLGDTRRHYTSVSLRSYVNHLSSQLTVARMDSGPSATQLSLQSGVGFSTFSLRHARIQDGFISEYFRNDILGSLRSTTDLNATVVPGTTSVFNTLGLALGARRDHYNNRMDTDTFYLRMGGNFRGLALTNDLNVTRHADAATPGARVQETTGTFNVSRFLRSVNLRATVNYGLGTKRELHAYSAFADLNLGTQNFLSTGVSRDLRHGMTTSNLSYSRVFPSASLSANVSYNRIAGTQVSLSLRSTLAREPRRNRWAVSGPSTAFSSAINALAYQDLNNNGVRDPGEAAREGVGFLVNGFTRPTRTDAEGIAQLNEVPAESYAYIKVNNASMDDPLWKSIHPGFRIHARPGHSALVELPVLAFGELDGTVYAQVDGQRHEVPGLLVELVDKAGNVVHQTRGSFDGYFILQDLMPGTYTLRVHAGDALKRGFRAGASRKVVVDATGTQLDGQDLEVTALPAPKKPVDLGDGHPAGLPTPPAIP